MISKVAKKILPLSVHPQNTWKTVRTLLWGQGLCLIKEIMLLTHFCEYIWESLGTESLLLNSYLTVKSTNKIVKNLPNECPHFQLKAYLIN